MYGKCENLRDYPKRAPLMCRVGLLLNFVPKGPETGELLVICL